MTNSNPMRTRRRFIGTVAGGVGALLCGCGKQGAGDGGSGKPLVVATTTMAADLMRGLCGGDAEVVALMGPQVDPHLFKPSQGDIQRVQAAAAVCHNGLHLEGRMAELLERLEQQGRPVFALAAGLPAERVIQADGAPDPHIWGDASLWAAAARHAGEELAALLPEQAGAVRERAGAVEKELLAVHERLRARAEEVPAAQRVLVTSHDAFRYFGRAYGFEVLAVQGISTVSEAALADMAKLSDTIRARKIKAVFVESSVSHATIEAISRETGATLGGELFSDALGEPGDFLTIGERRVDRGTVAGMLEANMDTIVKALK